MNPQKASKLMKFFNFMSIAPYILIPILVAILVLVIFILNTPVPEVLSMANEMPRPYNKQTIAHLLTLEKEYQETVDQVSENVRDMLNSVDVSNIHLADIKDHKLVPSGSYLTEEFCNINNLLLQYCNGVLEEEGISYRVTLGSETVEMDALIYMAMCNAESYGWMADPSRTISSVYPSGLIDTPLTANNALEMFAACNVEMVMNSQKAYSYTSMPFTTSATAPENGPSTQRFPGNPFSNCKVNKTPINEKTLFTRNAVTKDAFDKFGVSVYKAGDWEKILSVCTGAGTAANGDYGDRFNIHDQLCAFYEGQIKEVNKFNDTSYTGANAYTAVGLLRLAHWTPAALTSKNEGCKYIKDVIYFMTTNPECLAIIKKYSQVWLDNLQSGVVKNWWSAVDYIVDEMEQVEGFPPAINNGTSDYSKYINWMHSVGASYDQTAINKNRAACEPLSLILIYSTLDTVYSMGGAK